MKPLFVICKTSRRGVSIDLQANSAQTRKPAEELYLSAKSNECVLRHHLIEQSGPPNSTIQQSTYGHLLTSSSLYIHREQHLICQVGAIGMSAFVDI